MKNKYFKYYIMKNELICPIVEVELQLIARDDVIKDKNSIPNRNKPGKQPFKNLKDNDYKKVFNKAKNTLSNKEDKETILYYLYLIDSKIISGATLIETPIFKNTLKGDFRHNFKICYSLKEKTTFNILKKEIKQIEDHWKWSGDVTYKLTKFKLIKSPQLIS